MESNGKKKAAASIPAIPVSPGYIQPARRAGMIAAGCILSFLFMSYMYQNSSFEDGSFVSTGAISSPHADVETRCLVCHVETTGFMDIRCRDCHEKSSQFAIYDFATHYLYNSNDQERVTAAVQAQAGHEMACGTCHEEHLGRKNDLADVSDQRCTGCHGFDSFDAGHPEFEFVREDSRDDSTLLMTHLRHTVFVLRQKTGIDEIESLFAVLREQTGSPDHFFMEACLECHVPAPDGKAFLPPNFEKHCQKCHIKSDAAVMALPSFNPDEPDRPGVETITQMQQRGGPGLSWTFTVAPDIVSDEDGEVSKNRIIHKDPWILENLKRIRKQWLQDSSLAEVLPTTGDSAGLSSGAFYGRVIAVLREHTREFQSRSDLSAEAARLNLWLDRAALALHQPASAVGGKPVPHPTRRQDEVPGAPRSGEYLQLVADLTSANGPECGKCHEVKHAGLLPVQAEQQVLHRARFDHSAHVIRRRCTDCHDRIPLNAELLKRSVASYSTFKSEFKREFEQDRAATQNIPGVAVCQECHSGQRVRASCVTCHNFHPNKSQRVTLDLFFSNQGKKSQTNQSRS